MLEEKTMAPDFTLPNENGQPVTLSSFRGKKVVLYFYPKDNTPGCTKEACSLRDGYSAIIKKKAIVIGVSPDKAESHQKFIAQFTLPFNLLSDVDHAVMEQYGAWGEKTMYGKKVTGVKRSTFVIDENGIIVKIFRKVDTANHAEEVLPYL